MVFTIFMFIPRRPGMTPEEFRDYYENRHVPLVLSILDKDTQPVRHSRYYIQRDASAQGDAAVAPPLLYLGDPDKVIFDCVTMVEFEDKAHFTRFRDVFKHSPKKLELEEDQKMFEDESRFVALAVQEPMVSTRAC